MLDVNFKPATIPDEDVATLLHLLFSPAVEAVAA